MEESEGGDFVDGQSEIVHEASLQVSCIWCGRLHQVERPLDREAQKALADQFKAACGDEGADVVFDIVGGDYTEPALRAIACQRPLTASRSTWSRSQSSPRFSPSTK